jgi:filamentous hemagglutinin family protein
MLTIFSSSSLQNRSKVVFGFLPLALSCTVALADNLPTGFSAPLSSGVVSVGQSGNTQTITTNAQRSLGSFNRFDIGSGYFVDVNQPNANAMFVAKVRDVGAPSQILGTLNSNGAVGLINPAGIFVGPTGIINTQGGFLGTTQALKEQQFLSNGAIEFGANATNVAGASIINKGEITVGAERFVVLVAPTVENSYVTGVGNQGVITAKAGNVALGALNSFKLATKDGIVIGFDRTNVDLSAANRHPLADTTSGTTGINQFGKITATDNVSLLGTIDNYTNAGNGGKVALQGNIIFLAKDSVIQSGNSIQAIATEGVRIKGNLVSNGSILAKTTGTGGIDGGDISVGGAQGRDFVTYNLLSAKGDLTLQSAGNTEVSSNVFGNTINIKSEQNAAFNDSAIVGAKEALFVSANKSIELRNNQAAIDLFNDAGLPAPPLKGALLDAEGKTTLVAGEIVRADQATRISGYGTTTAADQVVISGGSGLLLGGDVYAQSKDIRLGGRNALSFTTTSNILADKGSVIAGVGFLPDSSSRANGAIFALGQLGSINGGVNLGAANRIVVDGSVYTSNAGSITVGAGNTIQVTAPSGKITSANGSINLGAGSDIVVDGNVGTGKGTISMGSGNSITINGLAGTAEGDFKLGTGGNIAINGEVGSGIGNIELGAKDDITITGKAGVGEGNATSGNGGTFTLAKGAYFGSGTGDTSIGSGKDIIIDGYTGSSTKNFTMGAGQDIKVSGFAGSAGGGKVEIGAGRDINITPTGFVGSNTGAVLVGSGNNVTVGGELGTNKNTLTVWAGNGLELQSTSNVGSNEGAVQLNALTNNITVAGKLGTNSSDLTLRAKKQVLVAPGVPVGSATGKVTIEEYAIFK